MIDWLDKHLVPEWRAAWKWSSVQLAALTGTLVSLVAAQPHILFTVLNYMPADPTQRGLVAAAIGAVAFFGPTILRVWNQHKGGDDAAAE